MLDLTDLLHLISSSKGGRKFFKKYLKVYLEREPEDDEKDYFENEGDLDDLRALLIEEADFIKGTLRGEISPFEKSPLHELFSITELIMNCPHWVTPYELRNIAKVKQFSARYPELFETLIIWAWG